MLIKSDPKSFLHNRAEQLGLELFAIKVASNQPSGRGKGTNSLSALRVAQDTALLYSTQLVGLMQARPHNRVEPLISWQTRINEK